VQVSKEEPDFSEENIENVTDKLELDALKKFNKINIKNKGRERGEYYNR
jgi:hypothetical protein